MQFQILSESAPSHLLGLEVDTAQAMRSHDDCERLADFLEWKLNHGETVGLGTWKIQRGNFTENPFDFEFTVSRVMTSDEPQPTTAGGLAHFILWPNRREINDALTSGVLDRQL